MKMTNDICSICKSADIIINHCVRNTYYRLTYIWATVLLFTVQKVKLSDYIIIQLIVSCVGNICLSIIKKYIYIHTYL